MRSRSLLVALTVLLTAALVVGLHLVTSSVRAAAGTDPALRADLNTLLADARLHGARAGLLVRNAETGATLYSRDAGSREEFASNTKLLTSAAALDVLGQDYRFDTSVKTTGTRSGGVLRGDVHLVGGGDPTMLAADYTALAHRLAAGGIRTVRGDLVADDTYFDATRLAPGWAWDDEPYYYDAQISALTMAPDTDYDAGSVIVRVAPGAVGKPAKVTLDPPNDYIKVRSTAVTGARGSAATINVDRVHGETTMVVSGSIPAGAAADEEFMSVWRPSAWVASVFRAALAKAGVRVTGPTEFRGTPKNARTVAVHHSIPLRRLLTPFLKLSNNMHAETLVKAMGRKVAGSGSWDAGIPVLTKALADLGVHTDNLSLVDGSGLSRMDQIAPREITDLLLAARHRPWFATWYAALPIAGNADRLTGGTLRHRMANTPAANNLHGKTGSYTGVSALSGYVTGADGTKLAFALVENKFLVSGDSMTQLEDAIAVRLARFGGHTATVQRLPAPRSTVDEPRNRHADLECAWRKAC